MSTWLLQAGGAPVDEDQGFDAVPAEGAWVLNDSWAYLAAFAAIPAEGSWSTSWAIHDSLLPLAGWSAGLPDISGSLAATLGALALAATGTVEIAGTLARTLAALALAGTGTVASVSGELILFRRRR